MNHVQLSRIIHGHWRLHEWNFTPQELLTFTKKLIELGVTTLDHADIYGNYSCEALFGNALRLDSKLRSQIQLISKGGIKMRSSNYPERKVKYYDYSAAEICATVDRSLHNFGTDYLDVFLLHRPSPFIDPEEVAKAFDILKTAGKVLEFGVSNFSPRQLESLQRFVSVHLRYNQVEISPLELEFFTSETSFYCQQQQIIPLAWSPLGGGKLFDETDPTAIRVRKTLLEIGEKIGAKSLEETAYAWILAHPLTIHPIVGSGKIDRIEFAVNATKLKLTTEDWFAIYSAALGHEVP